MKWFEMFMKSITKIMAFWIISSGREELRDHEGNNIDDIALMEDVRELVDDFLDKNK